MYILKNAMKGISRSKGRNILIGMIVFIISFAACISLSIRAASDKAAEEAKEGLSVTAQISVDRKNMMAGMENKEDRQAALEGAQDLSLEELEIYAEAESVSDFYYTASASLNGSTLEAIDLTGSSQEEGTQEGAQNEGPGFPQAGGQSEPQRGNMGTQGDFTVTGYSSDSAMTDFVNGTSSITDGEMFAAGSSDNTCVINDELASYNDLAVGDTITLSNPNNEEETYTLTISGIYEKETGEDSSSGIMGGFMAGADSSNQIYVSYATLAGILEASEESAVTETDSTTGQTSTTALHSMLNGTYVFSSVEAYEKFQEEAAEMGLSEDYTISSGDVSSYEESLKPLENLSEYAGYFLLIILVIGAAILAVLHIFSIRERKYEIGVLAAIGMKKWKISVQFLTEALLVTFFALFIGAAAGAVSSVPVTNQLLQNQIEASAQEQQEQRFGREMGGDMGGNQEPPEVSNQSEGGDTGMGIPSMQGASAYISSISSATDLVVLLEMMGIGIALTIVSGCTALVFIMRYDPLKILNSRD